MSDQSILESVFVLKRTEPEEEGTPPRALGISLLALLVAGTLPFIQPAETLHAHGFQWLLALIPCLLLAHYRGWKGAALALGIGMVALTAVEVGAATFLEGRQIDWWVYGIGAFTLIAASMAFGVSTELLQRSGGDPHLADRRWQTGRELRRALDREEFQLFYQPILDLRTGRVRGAEALIRWENPKVGTLPPSLFLPTAEATNLILPLGAWVTERACRDLAGWRERFEEEDRPFILHVNISPTQCAGEEPLRRSVVDPLERSEVSPDRLCFEITEGSYLEAEDGARILRELGAAVAIDDFGTEYASLEQLTWLSVDGLKIDRAFVQDLAVNERVAAVVRSIVELGHQMGMTVTAEGIDDEAQLRMLREFGCPYGQGFLFAQPLPLDDAFSLAVAVDGRFSPDRPG